MSNLPIHKSDFQSLTMPCTHIMNTRSAYKNGCSSKSLVNVCKVIRLDEFNKPMALEACSIECLEYLEKIWTHKITTHKNIHIIRAKY